MDLVSTLCYCMNSLTGKSISIMQSCSWDVGDPGPRSYCTSQEVFLSSVVGSWWGCSSSCNINMLQVSLIPEEQINHCLDYFFYNHINILVSSFFFSEELEACQITPFGQSDFAEHSSEGQMISFSSISVLCLHRNKSSTECIFTRRVSLIKSFCTCSLFLILAPNLATRSKYNQNN